MIKAISRCMGSKDNCSEFLRGTSVGHNEAAILNTIEQRLKEG
jgi:hypothetical protein